MRRLTKKQKLANRRTYEAIRRGWNKTGGQDLEGHKITYKQFKNRVKLRMQMEDVNARVAVRKELNTETFVNPAERSRHNLVQGIKEEFRGTYKEMLKLSRDSRGRFVKVEENLTWDNERGGYILGGKYFIDVTNSPKDVQIYEIN